ncbi:MAG TPA: DUF348 domain-containing protein [Clostridia bacterium]|nr:DUF348 domain-containing protein [Clostridia bacterium]
MLSLKKMAILVPVVFLVGALLLMGALGALKTVDVIDGEEVIPVTTFAFTVGQALKGADLEIRPEDKVIPDWASPVQDGMEIRILRAEKVCLEVDGKEWTVLLAGPEPLELLRKEQVFTGPLDRLEINLKSSETGGGHIKVTRIAERIVEETVSVPFDTLNQPDGQMERGQRVVLQEGKNGWARQEVLVRIVNGQETERKVLTSQIMTKPQKRIVAYGILDQSRSVARGQSSNVKKVMTMEATAYTHTGNPTATGIYPYRGVIAVDPKVIPLGTRVYVEGYGYAQAQDTGGLIKGDRIDLFMDTEKEAREWGRRVIQVHVLSD